ncbi:MAG: hypothetical protein ACRD0P_20070 [Stackebrandtia sp.]
MSDPYRIEDSSPAAPRREQRKPVSAVTVALWTIAAVFAGLNSAMSVAGNDLLGAVFGSIGLVFVTIAVVRHIRRRRS